MAWIILYHNIENKWFIYSKTMCLYLDKQVYGFEKTSCIFIFLRVSWSSHCWYSDRSEWILESRQFRSLQNNHLISSSSDHAFRGGRVTVLWESCCMSKLKTGVKKLPNVPCTIEKNTISTSCCILIKIKQYHTSAVYIYIYYAYLYNTQNFCMCKICRCRTTCNRMCSINPKTTIPHFINKITIFIPHITGCHFKLKLFRIKNVILQSGAGMRSKPGRLIMMGFFKVK